MLLLTLTIIVAEVVILSRIERRGRPSITPFIALAVPYAFVVLFTYFVGSLLGFVSLDPGSLMVWILGLGIFWGVGFVLLRIVIGSDLLEYVSEGFIAQFSGEDRSTRLVLVLALLLVPLLVIGTLKSVAAAGGWSALASPEFKAAYAQGFYGHILVLCEPLEVLLIGTATKNRKVQFTLAGILGLFFLVGQVKGRILQPLIAGFFYRFMRGRASSSLRSVGVVVLCGVLVFSLVYIASMASRDPGIVSNTETYIFLGRHFSHYTMAGVLGFSEAFREGTSQVGGAPSAIFTPFLNIYGVLSGNTNMKSWGSASDEGVPIDLLNNDRKADANVYSFFGTLYIYLGAIGACIYAAIAAWLCYGLWSAAGWSRNEWILVLYCLIAAELFFGYFEFYFWLLDPYEIAMYVGILALCSSFMKTPAQVSRRPDSCSLRSQQC